jgi:bifunctional non-homologous end joining protein LigD
MAAGALSKSKAAVRRQLARYRAMRDFNVTAEPRGNGARAARDTEGLPFVVQKHAAARLHYDFRLGWRGVLMSWAVTKGPSYFPGDRRLAVQVEDHPMEYGGFEGTIPKGQYGGGTVMVWDFGRWRPLGDVDRGLSDGHLKFELDGKKLHGRWSLVRMHRDGDGADKPNWLLIKDRDEYAQKGSDPAITEESPKSAMTRRTMEQIAKSADAVWDAKEGLLGSAGNNARGNGAKDTARNVRATNHRKPRAASAQNTKKGSGGSGEAQVDRLLRSAPKEKFPGFLSPQLAQAATAAPSGGDWVHELKLDGYRIQILVRARGRGGADHRDARLLTRKGLDWTKRMPDIARAATELPCESAILDGEVVALNDQGVANFADLQATFHEGRQHNLTYFAFDLLHLNGHNLRELPLVERKKILARLLAQTGEDSLLRFSEHFEADGRKVFAQACSLGAEGIVSKVAQSKYASTRSGAWLKVKCTGEQEFVIGGFTPPSNGGHGIGALLLGYYQRGKLIYAGRSGTGFTQRTQRSLRTQLDALLRKTPPFAEIPRDARRDARWVEPKLVAQIAFSTWTRDNLVRQASFKGLREDKPANEVTRETATPPQQPWQNGAAARGARQRPRTNEKGATPMAITHPEKILDPESGLTKQTLAEYYFAVAERMLPHIADRPLSVVRCPEGSNKPCFFQKHAGRGLAAGINAVAVENPSSGEKEEYLTLNSAEGLVGMAQMGVLEIHPWGSRNEALDRPDRIVFDLDPDTAIDWPTLAASAEKLRARLKKLHFESFVKSTGGKGLHVVVAIEPEHDWALVKQFAHAIVLAMEAEEPDLYITKMSKAARKNRIYLDYLRNDRGSTSVAPFSPRARSGAPVAITLDWKELRLDASPRFHVADFTKWQSRLKRDPWQAMTKKKQRLSATTLRAAGITGGAGSG